MRLRTWVGLLASTVVVLAGTPAIAATKPTTRQAERTLRSELKVEFYGAHDIDLGCKRLTDRRWRCVFALENAYDDFCYGKARVTRYSRGWDVSITLDAISKTSCY